MILISENKICVLVGSITSEFNFRILKGHLKVLDKVGVRSHPVKNP